MIGIEEADEAAHGWSHRALVPWIFSLAVLATHRPVLSLGKCPALPTLQTLQALEHLSYRTVFFHQDWKSVSLYDFHWIGVWITAHWQWDGKPSSLRHPYHRKAWPGWLDFACVRGSWTAVLRWKPWSNLSYRYSHWVSKSKLFPDAQVLDMQMKIGAHEKLPAQVGAQNVSFA